MNVLKLHFTILFFLVLMYNGTSQSSDFYYYYRGKKLPITIHKSKVTIISESIDQFTENIARKDAVKVLTSNNINKAGNYAVIEYEFDTQRGKNEQIDALTQMSSVLSIEPTIGNEKTIAVSNLFYVNLYKQSDYSFLEKVANTTRTRVLRKVEVSGIWYALETNKTSLGNSIEMANYFYETGYFAEVDPGFLINFSGSCRTDSNYNQQWAIDNTLIDINACEAWNMTTGCSNVVVAILDEPIDNAHNEFSGANFTQSYDANNRSSPASPLSSSSHGTASAGIIAANHNAGQIAGIAPGLSIMEVSIDLFDPNIIPSTAEDFAAGIFWAVENGADVINNSWGDQGGEHFDIFHSSMLEGQIDYALDNGRNGLGCVVVFAAGNEALASPGRIDYPGNYRDEILTVGAMTSAGTRAFFSAFGNELDVVAPGQGIFTTENGNSYSPSWFGTSIAAPHVSALAGLILSINPSLTGQEVVDIIESTPRKIGGHAFTNSPNRFNGTWNQFVGYGLIDAAAAIERATFVGFDYVCSGNTSYDLQIPGVSANWTVSPTNLFAVDNGTGSSFITRATNNSIGGEGTITATLSVCGQVGTVTKEVWVGKPIIEPNWQGNNTPIDIVPNTYEGLNIFPCIHWATTNADLPKTYYWELDPNERYRVKGETSWFWTYDVYDANANYWESSNKMGLYMTLSNMNLAGYPTGSSYITAENSCGGRVISGMGWARCFPYYSYSVYPNPMTSGTLNIAFRQESNESLTVETGATLSSSVESSDQFLVKEGETIWVSFHDKQGGTLFEQEIIGGKDANIDVSALRKDTYYVHICSESGTKKIQLKKKLAHN